MRKEMFILLIIWQCFSQTDMKDMLLNYNFERVRLTNAGKSKIIDFVKANDFDSLQTIINFCDSINKPNLEWLSNSERFYIEVLKENWDLLKKDSIYIACFHLSDTADTKLSFPDYCYTDFGYTQYARRLYDNREYLNNPSPIPENEDLSRFLRLAYEEKLSQLKIKMPSYEYMWDFFHLLFPNSKSGIRDNRNLLAKQYLVNYPKSPFYNLVLFNYYFNYKLSGNGGIFGLGAGYQTFDNSTLKLFKDRVNFDMYLDIYIKYVPVKIGWTVMTQNTNKTLIYGKDTLPSNILMTNMNWLIGTGYLIHFYDQLHITPYCGLSIISSSLTDSTKKVQNVDPHLPTLFGFQIGTTIDYQFKSSINDRNYYGFDETSILGCRLDFGIIYNQFSKISPDLGNVSLYTNIGLNFMGFGKTRIFTIRKDK